MRYLFCAFLLVSMFLSSVAIAEGVTVFASDIKSEIKNYNRVTDKLATSGALGEGAVEELASKNFKTIIDLRTPEEGTAEEKAAATVAGIEYINIPVIGGGIRSSQLVEFTKILESSKEPVLLHCGSGNRAGAMLMMYYINKGIDPNTAIGMARAAGLKPVMEQKMIGNAEVK